MPSFFRSFTVVVLLTMLTSLTACGGSSPEAKMEESIDIMNKMTSVLQTVQDKDSAKAAAPKVEKLVARMEAIEQDEAIKKLSQEEKEALAKKHEKELDAAMEGMMKEMMRIAFNPELAGELDDSFNKMR